MARAIVQAGIIESKSKYGSLVFQSAWSFTLKVFEGSECNLIMQKMLRIVKKR